MSLGYKEMEEEMKEFEESEQSEAGFFGDALDEEALKRNEEIAKSGFDIKGPDEEFGKEFTFAETDPVRYTHDISEDNDLALLWQERYYALLAVLNTFKGLE